jgi:hypothetical protein
MRNLNVTVGSLVFQQEGDDDAAHCKAPGILGQKLKDHGAVAGPVVLCHVRTFVLCT